jgi:hypothetical protein
MKEIHGSFPIEVGCFGNSFGCSNLRMPAFNMGIFAACVSICMTDQTRPSPC